MPNQKFYLNAQPKKGAKKMNRSTLDKLISSTGLLVAIVLIAASCALFYAHNFVHTQVVDQLSAEKIYFPPSGASALTALPTVNSQAMSKYAGQQLTTGAQAKVWANDFIAVHLEKIGGGETYAQLSTKAMADPQTLRLPNKCKPFSKGKRCGACS
jgi:hypothetical protein